MGMLGQDVAYQGSVPSRPYCTTIAGINHPIVQNQQPPVTGAQLDRIFGASNARALTRNKRIAERPIRLDDCRI
jgi:hypothetical protein